MALLFLADARSFHADTAASVDLNLSASPPASLIDNHKVIQHYDSGKYVHWMQHYKFYAVIFLGLKDSGHY